MNWVDLISIVIISLCAIIGWQKGFIAGLLDLIAWAGSITIGYFFYPFTAKGIEQIISIGAWSLPAAFLLTILAARLLIGIITMSVMTAVPVATNKSGFNKILGIIPGAIHGLIWSVIISAMLLMLPLKDSINHEIHDSYFAGELAAQTKWANKKLEPVFSQALEPIIDVRVIHPKADETIKLPFKSGDAIVRPSLETQMLGMINKERIKEGLKPLKADPELNRVARAHSKDMFKRGYFAHINPDGQNPFDRMKKANVNFISAGENLALAQTLEMAHSNLMKSPGHRANILNPSFGRVGIGILEDDEHGLMISQEFRD
jgi:uncharacterized protein YkwD/uncharacterized membrane protein required for colicin V production